VFLLSPAKRRKLMHPTSSPSPEPAPYTPGRIAHSDEPAPMLMAHQRQEAGDWLTLFASVSPHYQTLLRAALTRALNDSLPRT
jgi:hypothetical protein